MTTAVAEVGRKAKKRKKKRVGLSRGDETRMREKLRLIAPSEPWVDCQIKGFDDIDPKGEPIVYRFFDPKAFPPIADTTPMVTCPLCGHMVPPNSMETPRSGYGIDVDARCMDCRAQRIHEAHGGSPSAMAIETIQYRNLRLDEVKLESESIDDLKEEIRLIKCQWTREGPSPFLYNFIGKNR